MSGDLNPLHSDHDYASQTPIGFSLPAALLMATAIGLGSVDVPVPATVALVGMTWKFVKPVRVGESVAARWRLNRKREVENPQWGLASWQVDVIGPDGDVRASGEVSRLVARRTAAAEAAPRSRRRRGRRSSGSAGAPTPAVIQDVPEPAPADVPTPARRRRRRRSGGGNGGAGNGNHGGEAAASEPEPAPAQASAPPPALQPAAVESAGTEPEAAGIGRVIRRIRRR